MADARDDSGDSRPVPEDSISGEVDEVRRPHDDAEDDEPEHHRPDRPKLPFGDDPQEQQGDDPGSGGS